MKRQKQVWLATWFALLSMAMPGYSSAQDGGRVEVAGGYSAIRDYEGDETFPAGWFASVAVDLAGPLVAAGEASGSYKSMGGLDVELSMNIHTFMGGPRFAWRSSRVSPYVQVLLGSARFSTTYTLPDETLSDAQQYFAWAPGGGIDVPFSERAAIRVGASVRFIRSETSNPGGTEPVTYREFQFITGLAFR